MIHGQLDYRVPLSQGIAVFTALQPPPAYRASSSYYPDEGHSVPKPSGSIEVVRHGARVDDGKRWTSD